MKKKNQSDFGRELATKPKSPTCSCVHCLRGPVLSLKRTVKTSGALLPRSRVQSSLEGVSVLPTQLFPAEETLCSTCDLLRRQITDVFEMSILLTSRNTQIQNELHIKGTKQNWDNFIDAIPYFSR